MKKLAIFLFVCVILTGCKSEDPAMTKFQNEMNTFCDNLKQIDGAINKISNITADEAGLAAATNDLMFQLDCLKDEFAKFANIDFPTDYDYLEQYADEASDYMNEAVKSYHTVYEDNYTVSMEDYAKENYTRAYKRVQIILNVLHGKDPNA